MGLFLVFSIIVASSSLAGEVSSDKLEQRIALSLKKYVRGGCKDIIIRSFGGQNPDEELQIKAEVQEALELLQEPNGFINVVDYEKSERVLNYTVVKRFHRIEFLGWLGDPNLGYEFIPFKDVEGLSWEVCFIEALRRRSLKHRSYKGEFVRSRLAPKGKVEVLIVGKEYNPYWINPDEFPKNLPDSEIDFKELHSTLKGNFDDMLDLIDVDEIKYKQEYIDLVYIIDRFLNDKSFKNYLKKMTLDQFSSLKTGINYQIKYLHEIIIDKYSKYDNGEEKIVKKNNAYDQSLKICKLNKLLWQMHESGKYRAGYEKKLKELENYAVKANFFEWMDTVAWVYKDNGNQKKAAEIYGQLISEDVTPEISFYSFYGNPPGGETLNNKLRGVLDNLLDFASLYEVKYKPQYVMLVHRIDDIKNGVGEDPWDQLGSISRSFGYFTKTIVEKYNPSVVKNVGGEIAKREEVYNQTSKACRLNKLLWEMHESEEYQIGYEKKLQDLEDFSTKAKYLMFLGTVAWVYKDNGNRKRAIEIYTELILPEAKKKWGLSTQNKYKNFYKEISKTEKEEMADLNKLLWEMHKAWKYQDKYNNKLNRLETYAIKNVDIGWLDTVAWVHKDTGNQERATEIYENIILPEVKNELKYDSAIISKYENLYKSITKIRKEEPDFLNKLLSEMHKSGKYQAGYEIMLEELESYATKIFDIDYLDTVAWVYKDNGNRKKAIKIYETFLLPALKNITSSYTKDKYKTKFREIGEKKATNKADSASNSGGCFISNVFTSHLKINAPVSR